MFTFKGISTKEMRIIVEEPDNLIAKAPIKHEILNIEGRDDAIYYPLGRSPIEISLTLQLLDPSQVDQVLMWLDGEGELIYKDRKTEARIFSEVQPIRTSGIRLINIDIVRAPYWDIIEDDYSKPWGANLIPNGWDSFEPYGSGINYVENWDFSSDDLSQWNGVGGLQYISNNIYIKEIKDKVNKNARLEIKATIPLGEYKVRIKIKSNFKYKKSDWHNIVWFPDVEYFPSNEFIVLEYDIKNEKEDVVLRWYVEGEHTADKQTFFVDWIQITPTDNQHLVVEKASLENGLNRIQTWGGNHRVKFIYYNAIGKDYTAFFYLETKQYFNFLMSNGKTENFENYKGFMYMTDSYKLAAVGRIRTEYIKDNLDFIASTPVIVEGDKAPTWEADEHPRIVNKGNAIAKPLIRLTKGTSSTCEFEVNGVYFKYHFNQDEEVIIDCEKMDASDKAQLRNRHLTIGYEFPKLDPGPNVVKTISGDATIEFKRKDRWL